MTWACRVKQYKSWQKTEKQSKERERQRVARDESPEGTDWELGRRALAWMTAQRDLYESSLTWAADLSRCQKRGIERRAGSDDEQERSESKESSSASSAPSLLQSPELAENGAKAMMEGVAAT
jgi:hypothetical protein